MRYTLSKNQIDELMDRATEIVIVLPMPARIPENPENWAKAVLPPTVTSWITDVEERSVLVQPPRNPRKPDTDNLADWLGSITILDRVNEDTFLVWIAVIAVTITPPSHRHSWRKTGKMAWPINCQLGGRKVTDPFRPHAALAGDGDREKHGRR